MVDGKSESFRAMKYYRVDFTEFSDGITYFIKGWKYENTITH